MDVKIFIDEFGEGEFQSEIAELQQHFGQQIQGRSQYFNMIMGHPRVPAKLEYECIIIFKNTHWDSEEQDEYMKILEENSVPILITTKIKLTKDDIIDILTPTIDTETVYSREIQKDVPYDFGFVCDIIRVGYKVKDGMDIIRSGTTPFFPIVVSGSWEVTLANIQTLLNCCIKVYAYNSNFDSRVCCVDPCNWYDLWRYATLYMKERPELMKRIQ